MTFQIFKERMSRITVLVCVALFGAVVNASAQENQMQSLINQSLEKLRQPSPETLLTCVAELKRIEVMYPDSVQPKYQAALQSLNYAVMNPQAEQTEPLLADVERLIDDMAGMKQADESDVCTLRGFLFMVRIVQNPVQNGQRYYLDVLQNHERALAVNPKNELARMLKERFMDGMRAATGN